MPRPRRPKLVQTVPSTLRVAKSASTTSEQIFIENDKSNDRAVPNGHRSVRIGKARGNQISAGGGALSPKKGADSSMNTRLGNVENGLTIVDKDTKHQGGSETTQKQNGKVDIARTTEPILPEGPGSAADWQPSPLLSRHKAPRMRSANRRPSPASKLHSTPLAQSFVLGAFNFRKRARQPSLLQVAQSQQDANTDHDDLDFQDFKPDNESTPLVKSLSRSRELTSSSQQSSNPRKRKLTSPEMQVMASQSQTQPQRDQPSSVLGSSSHQEDYFDLPPQDEGELREPILPRLRQGKTPSPEISSDTLAPPQSSSSPVIAPLEKRSRRGLTSGREAKRPSLSPSLSPRSSTSASQHTPPRKALRPPKPLTTARLQNLLPRRRLPPRQQSTYDIPSSSEIGLDATNLGEDEDELSFHATNKMRRKMTTDAKSEYTQSKTGKGKTEKPLKGKRASKTYSRKSVVESHSENDNGGGNSDEDTGIEMHGSTGKEMPVFDSKAKAEMKRLADKFREVDEFTLDFEDMTGSSSQMKDAR